MWWIWWSRFRHRLVRRSSSSGLLLCKGKARFSTGGKKVFWRESENKCFICRVLFTSFLWSRRLLLDLLAAEEELELRQLQLGQVERADFPYLEQNVPVFFLKELSQLDTVPANAVGYEAEKEALLLAELAAVVQVYIYSWCLLSLWWIFPPRNLENFNILSFLATLVFLHLTPVSKWVIVSD